MRIMSSELDTYLSMGTLKLSLGALSQFMVFQFPNILCNRLSQYLLKGTVSDIETLKVYIYSKNNKENIRINVCCPIIYRVGKGGLTSLF